MGTEVLRPHNCLNQRFGVASPAIFPRRKFFYGTPKINRKQAVRQFPDRSKPSITKRTTSDDLKSTKNNIVVGQVTILRRGESLDSKIKSAKNEDPVVSGTGRFSPEIPPAAKVRTDMYAGSAFAMSPSPSSLPVPSFSKKKQVSPVVVVDDSATRDLRRLLRLE